MPLGLQDRALERVLDILLLLLDLHGQQVLLARRLPRRIRLYRWVHHAFLVLVFVTLPVQSFVEASRVVHDLLALLLEPGQEPLLTFEPSHLVLVERQRYLGLYGFPRLSMLFNASELLRLGILQILLNNLNVMLLFGWIDLAIGSVAFTR